MPKDRLSWDEFRKRMDGFDENVREIIEERLRTNYTRARHEFLTDEEAVTLRAVLDRLIPQEAGDKIDLVGFMDWAIPHPLGYGDRREGMPDEPTLFREGFKGIEQAAHALGGRTFVELEDHDKDEVIRLIQEGNAKGEVWERIPGNLFFNKLMQKAIAGYCAHPKVWMRIGFYGPSYPEGYVWVSSQEVKSRHEKKRGYLDF